MNLIVEYILLQTYKQYSKDKILEKDRQIQIHLNR
jgi:hypothetical protein